MTRRRIALAVVAIAALIAAWWWHGRARAVHRGDPVASSSRGSAIASARIHGPAPRARLEGRVHDGDGEPVPGAVVQAVRKDAAPAAIAANADGTFAFDQVATGGYVVSASAPGYLPRRRDVVLRAHETTTVELVLVAGGTPLRGTVTDTAGGPIEGALIIAAPDGDDDVRAAGVAFTGADGRYAMSLAPGRYVIVATHPEYVGAAAKIAIADAAATLDLTLLPGGTIEGVVEELATGAPVPDATVTVERDVRSWRGAGANRPVTAGADGGFRITGLPPGPLVLHARDDPGGRETVNAPQLLLALGEQRAGVVVWVHAAPYVEGRVVDAAGAPVAEARVVFMCARDYDERVANADGEFRVSGAPRASCALTASSKRHRAGPPVEITLTDAPITGVTLTVTAAPAVIGRVDPPGPAAITVERDGRTMEQWRDKIAFSATADADGRFEVTPMEPGPHTLRARADDGRRGAVTVTLPASGAVDAIIHLGAGASLTGHVRDRDGAPMTGASVLVKAPAAARGADPEAARTDAGGGFAFRGLDAGTYRLGVVDDRGGPVRWAGAADEARARAPMTVTLAAGEEHALELIVEREDGTITGVVRNPDGTPRADAWVTAALRFDELWSSGPDDPLRMRTASVATTDGGRLFTAAPPALTGPDGRFELRGLRLGGYDVTADADGGALHGRADRVRTGTAAVIELRGLASISGTVTRGGAPVTDFTVTIQSFGPNLPHPQAFHDAGGHFRLVNLEPKPYLFRADSATGTGTGDADLQAGQDVQVTIELVDKP